MKQLAFDPVDVLFSSGAGVIQRALTFFAGAWLGFALGLLCSGFHQWRDLIDLSAYFGLAVSSPLVLASAPLAWPLAVAFGCVNPILIPGLLVFPAFFFLIMWSEWNRLALFVGLLATAAVHGFIYAEGEPPGVIPLAGAIVALGALAWTAQAASWNRTMRELDAVEAEIAARRMRRSESSEDSGPPPADPW